MAQEFISTTRRPQVGFLREGVPPPAALYIFRDDNLNLESWGSVAGVGLLIAGRVMLPDGSITQFVFNHTPSSDRSRGSTDFQLTEGYLLGLTVIESTALVKRGQVFARANLIRGQGAAARLDQVLCEGYVAQFQPLWWPPGKQNSAIEGPGVLRTITGTNPAAGVDWSETVPTNAVWRLISIRALLTASAVVANRRPVLRLDDGATQFFTVQGAADQTASQAVGWNWSQGGPAPVMIGAFHSSFLPVGVLLYEGYRVYVNTSGLQAGDDWAAPGILVEEWIQE